MTNLLYNPSFEMGFSARGSGEIVVAEGWEIGYNSGFGHRPEWQEERRDRGEGRVRDGDSAQKVFTTYAPHEAWVSQKVMGLMPGKFYRLTAWAYVWSSDHDDPDHSDEPGKVWVQAALNPWGEAWYKTPSTETGLTWCDQYDDWVQVECVTRAMASEIVAFLYSRAEYGVKHNDVYWDVTCLELLEPEASEPPPPPPEGLTEEMVRRIVRSELDQTRLTFANPGVLRTLEGPSA